MGIQIIRPNRQVPEYLKQYQQWVPDLGTKLCAAIYFEKSEDAQKACREVNMTNREDKNLRVALLKPGARIKRTLYRKYGSSTKPVEKQATCGYLAGSSNGDCSSAKSDSTKSLDGENGKEQFTTQKFITLVNWRDERKQEKKNSFKNFTVHRQPKGPCDLKHG